GGSLRLAPPVTVRVADLVPAVSGLKRTLMLHMPPACSSEPSHELSLMAKSLASAPSMVAEKGPVMSPPALVTVKVPTWGIGCGPVGLAMGTVLKSNTVGASRTEAGMRALAFSSTTNILPGLAATIRRAILLLPATTGRNDTDTSQLLP